MVTLASFSVVVSDALVNFQEVLTKEVDILGKIHATLNNNNTTGTHQKEYRALKIRTLLVMPLLVVITLKLPCKSKTSMKN